MRLVDTPDPAEFPDPSDTPGSGDTPDAPGPADPVRTSKGPGAAADPSDDGAPAGDLGRARRPWSPRGVPAGLVALLLGAAAGTALYIAASARISRAPRWSRDALEWVQTHDWRNDWILAGGLVAAALGLWLVVLAVTPGRRSLLPLRPPGGDMTVYMTRRTAAALLRHTALAVSGVLDARVRMGRRKAVVRVDYHFRDQDELHGELRERLADRASALTLARVPRVDVRLQPVSGR